MQARSHVDRAIEPIGELTADLAKSPAA